VFRLGIEQISHDIYAEQQMQTRLFRQERPLRSKLNGTSNGKFALIGRAPAWELVPILLTKSKAVRHKAGNAA
jgi:hypothetical protein